MFTYEGDEAGLEHARLAAAEWGDVCGAALIVNRDPGGIPLVQVDYQPDTNMDAATWKTNDGRTGRVEVMTFGGRATYAHEMGHVLGLEHVASGLMALHADPTAHVTRAECDRIVWPSN